MNYMKPILRHNPSETDGPCYLVKDEAKSFQEAEDFCSDLGGHLASAHLASILTHHHHHHHHYH